MKDQHLLIDFLCAFCFGTGLIISGMTQPAIVTAFLDFGGNWDPTLLWVMLGAISIYSVGSRFILRRSKPVYANSFLIPSPRAIDRELIIGAGLFGIGWGLAGFCPGPALVSAGHSAPAFLVLLGMALGVVFYDLFRRYGARSE